MVSKNPSDDLANQEKNQYWTVYWFEQGALYTEGRSDQEKYLDKEADQ